MASVKLRALRKRTRGGFILESALSAILITLCIVPLCLCCIAPLRNMMEFRHEIMDEISALQLRRVLLLSEDLTVSEAFISFNYQEREMSLSRTNRNVIMTPGTQIYFTDCDSCRFICEGELLWIVYERDGKENRKVLAKIP